MDSTCATFKFAQTGRPVGVLWGERKGRYNNPIIELRVLFIGRGERHMWLGGPDYHVLKIEVTNTG